MKNYFKISILAIALFTMAIGCKDSFLDTPPQAALSGDLLASNKNGVNATLISAYKSLLGWTGNWSAGPWGTSNSNWELNLAADDTHKGSEPGDGDGWQKIELFQWSPADGTLNAKWIAVYEGIVRANSAINTANAFAKNNPGDKAFADAAIGEATFLRAFFHFEAYKVWRNAPYYYEGDVDFKKPNDQPMIPLIIKDMEAAIALLPEKKTATGRVDKMVATSFLGKVKLYNKDYAGALAAFNTVIASGRYALADCFHDNFAMGTNNNKESIFEAQTSVNDGDGDGGNAAFGDRLGLPHGDSPWGCCGFKQPTFDLAYAYKVDDKGLPMPVEGATLKRLEAGASDVLDPRIDWTIGRTNVPYLDWGVHKDSWIRGQGFQGWYSPKKNAQGKTDGNVSGSWASAQLNGLNVVLMRYADLLLMAAEAEVEVGSLENAQKYVNQVRTRAGNCAQGKSGISVKPDAAEITWAKYKISPYTGAWTKDGARTAVRLERRLELALEGHRVFDLQRWGNLIDVVKSYNAREVKLVPINSTALAPEAKHLMFPLPTIQVDLASGKLKQNTGF